MNGGARSLAKLLMWVHLFVCVVWLFLFRAAQEPPMWTLHVFGLSILIVQFTWGMTVGLAVGPSRKRRPLLWWSLLTVFMPLWIYGQIAFLMMLELGPIIAALYLGSFVIILASETYCGVLLGAKMHSESQDD